MKNEVNQLAHLAVRMVEGDDVLEELYNLLWKMGYTDKEGFWIYED